MRKQTLYFPMWMFEEIDREAKRLDRSRSWIVYQAWLKAKKLMQHDIRSAEYAPISETKNVLPGCVSGLTGVRPDRNTRIA